MTAFVLDASVAASWFLPAQATPAASALLQDAREHRFHVPLYFDYEIRHVLARSWRRGDLSDDAVRVSLGVIEATLLQVAPQPSSDAMNELLDLALATELSFYDTVYLDLALQMQLPLASRDMVLLTAAVKHGLPVYDVRASA